NEKLEEEIKTEKIKKQESKRKERRKMKQLCLLKNEQTIPAAFGGNLAIDYKRQRRPLSTKNPTHLVLKAKSSFRLLRSKSEINKILFKQAKTFGIKIYSLSVQKDHIHLNIKIFSRE